MVLSGENVTGCPADIGTEFLQGLDEHTGLDGHVQGASDADASKRLFRTVLLACGHEAWHFALGDVEFFTAKFGEADIFYFIVGHVLCLGFRFGVKWNKSTYQDTLICSKEMPECQRPFSPMRRHPRLRLGRFFLNAHFIPRTGIFSANRRQLNPPSNSGSGSFSGGGSKFLNEELVTPD